MTPSLRSSSSSPYTGTNASSIFSTSSVPTLGPRESSPFKVLIIGAGVGGLMMGVCLERAGIDYVILERTQQLPIPRTTIQLTANTLRSIEQLGLLNQVMKISKPMGSVTLRKHNMSIVGKRDATYVKDRYGHYSCIVQKTEFLEILLSCIPTSKVQWGRYVLDIVNGNAGVQCRCANGVVEEADMLIGADGAYSAVRQNLYRALREKNQLPKSDMEPLKFTLNAVIGISDPLDPEQYPMVESEFGDVEIIVGKENPYTLWLTTTVGNRIAWSVGGELLTPEGSDDINFKQSEFGPEAIDATCTLIQDLALPWGGTLGDIIQHTRRDFITKVMVEEKHYKTWHHGRAVLIGEACHKFVPYSGQGAEQAILDVICLVNLLYRVPANPSHKDFCAVFEAYYAQRSPIAKSAVEVSNSMSHLMNAQGLSADIKRKVLFNLPDWITISAVDRVQVRPLLTFLTPVEDRGYKKAVSTPF